MEHNPTGTTGAVVFDRAGALAGVDDDLELLQELAELFLEDCPGMVQALHDAVAAGDAEAVKAAAHRLKGSVGVLAAVAVMDLTAEMEAHGRAGTLDPVAALDARLDGEIAKLTAALHELLAA